MKAKYEDILELARQLEGVTVKPQWYDENGVPRFVEHHPKYAANIYAYEVVLMRIQCCGCGKPFLVQMSHSNMDDVHLHNRWTQAKERGVDIGGYDEFMARNTLAGRVTGGTIHYGDPPRHPLTEDDRCAGETMNCDDIAIVEFWRNDKTTSYDWTRIPELERALPDAKSMEC